MINKRGNAILIGTIVLVVIAAAFFIFWGNGTPSESSETITNTESDSAADTGEGSIEIVPIDEETSVEPIVKTFKLDGENYRFIRDGVSNPDLVVNEGDTVRIEFTSTSGFHDWVLAEFGASTERVQSTDGNPTTVVEFVADKKGTFEYYCSVGAHRANGMNGKFIVN